MKHTLISLAILSTFSVPLLAAEATEEKRNWDASAELGFNLTSGNTDTSTLKARIDAKHNMTSWENTYVLDILRKDDDGNKSADKWLIGAKGNYKLEKENAFLFIEATREEDRVGLYDNYNTIAFGYGQRIYGTKDLTIDADIGPGYVFSETNIVYHPDGTIKQHALDGNSGMIQVSGALKWTINESAIFTQGITINSELSNEKNTKTRLESGLSAKINGSLRMKLGLTITHNTEVPIGRKETDTETSVTLVYAF